MAIVVSWAGAGGRPGAGGDLGVVRGDVAANVEGGRENVDLAIGLELEPGLARGVLQERRRAVELESAEALDGAGVDSLVGSKLEAGEREEAAARACEEGWQGLACDRGELLGTCDEILFAAALTELAQRSGGARQDGAAVIEVECEGDRKGGVRVDQALVAGERGRQAADDGEGVGGELDDEAEGEATECDVLEAEGEPGRVLDERLEGAAARGVAGDGIDGDLGDAREIDEADALSGEAVAPGEIAELGGGQGPGRALLAEQDREVGVERGARGHPQDELLRRDRGEQRAVRCVRHPVAPAAAHDRRWDRLVDAPGDGLDELEHAIAVR
jgi:hypothetical protein